MNDDDVKVVFENVLPHPKENNISAHASTCATRDSVIQRSKVPTERMLPPDNTVEPPKVSTGWAHKIKAETSGTISEHIRNQEISSIKTFSSERLVKNEQRSPFTSDTSKRTSKVAVGVTDLPSKEKGKRKLSESNKPSVNTERNSVEKCLTGDEWETLTSITNIVKLYDECLLECLKFHAEVVLDNCYPNLISEAERETIHSFFGMDADSKYTYASMYNKKYKCHRFSDYQPNETVMKNIDILKKKNFLVTDAIRFNIDDLLDVMKFPEIKKLCESLGLKCTGHRRKDYLEAILQYSQMQMHVEPESISTKDIREFIINIVGRCFMLTPELCGLLQRIHFLYNIKCNEREQFKFNCPHAEASASTYPDYIIDTTARIFTSREELLRFQIAVDIWMKFSERVEAKQWVKANKILSTIRDNCTFELTNCSSSISASLLPLCLREYTSGSVYTYALYKGTEVLKRLKMQEQAVMDITLLLGQRIYLHYLRGRWYEQMISIHQSSGRIEEVAKTIKDAINDPYVDEQGRYVVSSCTAEILRKKKGVSPEVKGILQCIPSNSAVKCKETCVIGTFLHGRSGSNLYIQEDEHGDKKCFYSVEELVKHHYCPRLFENGIHAGNSLVLSLFGLLFWDMIYRCPVPCAFISLYQTKPLDLTTGEFYKNRQASFDRKLYEMADWSSEEIASWIKEVYVKQKDKKSIVHWELFQDSEYILDIINCIGWNVLLKICERLAKNYRIACSGFPEYFMWSPRPRNQYKFIEVQHPKIKLLANHRMWRNFLLEINACVEICFISAQQLEAAKFGVDAAVQLHDKSKENDKAEIEEITLL